MHISLSRMTSNFAALPWRKSHLHWRFLAPIKHAFSFQSEKAFWSHSGKASRPKSASLSLSLSLSLSHLLPWAISPVHCVIAFQRQKVHLRKTSMAKRCERDSSPWRKKGQKMSENSTRIAIRPTSSRVALHFRFFLGNSLLLDPS